ncbi:MAG: RDD family protein [Myxococcaceae bacterium]|nr:RDD family protein [Myxococcaceae bacterium]
MTPASAQDRIVAKIIDALLSAGVLALGWRWSNGTAAIALMYAWFIGCDGWGSWGKWIVGIRCVHAETGARCTVVQSVQRNLIFVPSLVRVLWVAGARETYLTAHRPLIALISLGGLALVALEARFMSRRADKRRLGDAMGNTRVVKGRAPLFA